MNDDGAMNHRKGWDSSLLQTLSTLSLQGSRNPIRSLLLQSFHPLFFIYIVLLILLPSGNFFGANIKVILFVVLAATAVMTYCNLPTTSYLTLSGVLGIPALLLSWVLIAQFYKFDFGMSLSQYRDFIVTIAGCWFISIFGATRKNNYQRFLRLVIASIFCTSGIKLLIFAYAFVTGVSVNSIVELISTAFGTQLMTVDLGDLGGRIEFISDGLIPLCLFAVFGLRPTLKISQKYALCFSIFSIVSSLFSFSRYLWVFSLLGILLGLLVAKKELYHWAWLALGIAVVVYNFDTLSLVVAFRFSDTLAGSSDLERTVQAVALKHFFWEAPFWGHGLGSYTWQVIRSEKLPYSYENQLLALAGQVGIIGILLLLALLVFYFRDILPKNRREVFYKLSLLALLFTWIGGGLVNPCLISSTASVSYGMLLALIQTYKTEVTVPWT